MTKLTYLIGVDGGGTKTAVLLAGADGSPLGRGAAPSSNYQKVGFAAATRAISSGISAAFADAGIAPHAPAAVCLGLSGVDTDDDRRRFEEWAAQHFAQSRSCVVNDAELALAAGTPAGVGVALICGTGAIVVGRNHTGQMARADGWGWLLGDDGSGYAIGVAALRAVLRAFDGRGPATLLSQTVLQAWEMPAPEALLDAVYLREASPATIAALAVVVNDAAETGDAVARQILEHAADELAQTIAAVVHRLGLNADGAAAPCALAGSVVTRSRLVAAALEQRAAARGLRLAPVTPVTEPVYGALRLAQKLQMQG